MSIIDSLSEGYQHLWKKFIQPERVKYNLGDIAPKRQMICQGTIMVDRISFKVKHHEIDLFCTLLVPTLRKDASSKIPEQLKPGEFPPNAQKKACLVYFHSHTGSSIEGSFLLYQTLPKLISLCIFDFGGAGYSTGQYITLGHQEQEQAASVLFNIKKKFRYERIGVWGKSMGAVAAILLASETSIIDAMVLDSPFDTLENSVNSIMKQNSGMPSLLIGGTMGLLSGTLKEKAGFDLYQIRPIDVVKKIDIPSIFLTGEKDNIVPLDNFMNVYRQYGGPKEVYVIEGRNHSDNEIVDQQLKNAISRFFDENLLKKVHIMNQSVNASRISFEGIPNELSSRRTYRMSSNNRKILKNSDSEIVFKKKTPAEKLLSNSNSQNGMMRFDKSYRPSLNNRGTELSHSTSQISNGDQQFFYQNPMIRSTQGSLQLLNNTQRGEKGSLKNSVMGTDFDEGVMESSRISIAEQPEQIQRSSTSRVYSRQRNATILDEIKDEEPLTFKQAISSQNPFHKQSNPQQGFGKYKMGSILIVDSPQKRYNSQLKARPNPLQNKMSLPLNMANRYSVQNQNDNNSQKLQMKYSRQAEKLFKRRQVNINEVKSLQTSNDSIHNTNSKKRVHNNKNPFHSNLTTNQMRQISNPLQSSLNDQKYQKLNDESIRNNQRNTLIMNKSTENFNNYYSQKPKNDLYSQTSQSSLKKNNPFPSNKIIEEDNTSSYNIFKPLKVTSMNSSPDRLLRKSRSVQPQRPNFSKIEVPDSNKIKKNKSIHDKNGFDFEYKPHINYSQDSNNLMFKSTNNISNLQSRPGYNRNSSIFSENKPSLYQKDKSKIENSISSKKLQNYFKKQGRGGNNPLLFGGVKKNRNQKDNLFLDQDKSQKKKMPYFGVSFGPNDNIKNPTSNQPKIINSIKPSFIQKLNSIKVSRNPSTTILHTTFNSRQAQPLLKVNRRQDKNSQGRFQNILKNTFQERQPEALMNPARRKTNSSFSYQKNLLFGNHQKGELSNIHSPKVRSSNQSISRKREDFLREMNNQQKQQQQQRYNNKNVNLNADRNKNGYGYGNIHSKNIQRGFLSNHQVMNR